MSLVMPSGEREKANSMLFRRSPYVSESFTSLCSLDCETGEKEFLPCICQDLQLLLLLHDCCSRTHRLYICSLGRALSPGTRVCSLIPPFFGVICSVTLNDESEQELVVCGTRATLSLLAFCHQKYSLPPSLSFKNPQVSGR